MIEEVSNSLSESNHRLAPTLAFVDPFGLSGVPMELIANFLDSPKCELFLILMVDHLNRFLSTAHMKRSRDSLFGTSDFSTVEAAPLVGAYRCSLICIRHNYAMSPSSNMPLTLRWSETVGQLRTTWFTPPVASPE